MTNFYTRLLPPRIQRWRKTPRGSNIMVRIHDAALFTVIFAAAILLCDALSKIFLDNNQFTIPMFILAVALIARGTTGYIWSMAASILGVFCSNLIFAYPYWEFDITPAGYPLTFAAMLIVSLIISTLTFQLKKQEQLKLAMEMERMRSDLLRSVSHDLRTPLTSIIGSSSVLMEDEGLTPERQRELLKEINKDARWLARVTENILSITRFSSDQVQLRKDDEVIEEIVSSTIVKFRRTHPEIYVYVEHPEEILLAPMDATLIEQVLINLLDNAATHGEFARSARISISSDSDWVQVSVEDDGVGIPKDALDELFDGVRFVRSDDGRHMGIGLSVCRSIIHAHGGTISARNVEAGGACFTFRLPLHQNETAEATN